MSAQLAALNVQAARRQRLAAQLASETGLSIAAVRGRLARAHGRMLLRNLFADVWSPARPAPHTSEMRQRASPAQGTQRTIHRVRQEFTTSCGVAVVAMFARVSHAEAMKVMFPETRRRTFYTHLNDVKRALDHFGVRYGEQWHRFRAWDDIAKTSLVKVRWEFEGRVGLHWVIFQRRADDAWAVIDPDPPRRGGTQRLSPSELDDYVGITYLPVDARAPSAT